MRYSRPITSRFGLVHVCLAVLVIGNFVVSAMRRRDARHGLNGTDRRTMQPRRDWPAITHDHGNGGVLRTLPSRRTGKRKRMFMMPNIKRGCDSSSSPRRKILEGNSVIARVVWLRLIEIHRCEALPRYPDNGCTVRRTNCVRHNNSLIMHRARHLVAVSVGWPSNLGGDGTRGELYPNRYLFRSERSGFNCEISTRVCA